MHTNRTADLGFTLIELSIVLVVIGLIVGGILVGQELVRAAAVRATISDLQKYKTAAQTFIGKYNCIPGDCSNATQFFGVANNGLCPIIYGWTDGQFSFPSDQMPNAGTCNGWGLGRIQPFEGNGNGYQPPGAGNYLFWDHLKQAGLIPGWVFNTTFSTGTVITSPQTALNGSFYTIGWLDNNKGYSGATWPSIAGVRVWPGMVEHNLFYLGYQSMGPAISATPAQAYAIDSKIDDGLPASGSAFGEGPGGGWMVSISYSSGCVTSTNPATAIYDLTQTGVNCNMAFYAGF